MSVPNEVPRKYREPGNRPPANGQHFIALLVWAELDDVRAYQVALDAIGVQVRHHWRPSDGHPQMPEDVEVVLLAPIRAMGSSALPMGAMRDRSAFVSREWTRRPIVDSPTPAKAVEELRTLRFVAEPIKRACPVVITPPPPPALPPLPATPPPQPQPPQPQPSPSHPEPKPEPRKVMSQKHGDASDDTKERQANRKAVGEIVRAARKTRGMSAGQLALLVGLPEHMIFNLEAGLISVPAKGAKRIEKRLKLTPGTLPRREGPGRPPGPRLARGTATGRLPQAQGSGRPTPPARPTPSPGAGVMKLAPSTPANSDDAPSEDAVVAMMRIRGMLNALAGVRSVEIKAVIGGYVYQLSGGSLSATPVEDA